MARVERLQRILEYRLDPPPVVDARIPRELVDCDAVDGHLALEGDAPQQRPGPGRLARPGRPEAATPRPLRAREPRRVGRAPISSMRSNLITPDYVVF